MWDMNTFFWNKQPAKHDLVINNSSVESTAVFSSCYFSASQQQPPGLVLDAEKGKESKRNLQARWDLRRKSRTRRRRRGEMYKSNETSVQCKERHALRWIKQHWPEGRRLDTHSGNSHVHSVRKFDRGKCSKVHFTFSLLFFPFFFESEKNERTRGKEDWSLLLTHRFLWLSFSFSVHRKKGSFSWCTQFLSPSSSLSLSLCPSHPPSPPLDVNSISFLH